MVLSNARDCIGLEVNSPSSSPRPEVRLPTSRASHSSHRCSIVSSPRPQSLQSVGTDSSIIACHLLSNGWCPVLNLTSMTSLPSWARPPPPSGHQHRPPWACGASTGHSSSSLSWRQPSWLPGRLRLSPAPARSPSLPSRQQPHFREVHSGRGPTQVRPACRCHRGPIALFGCSRLCIPPLAPGGLGAGTCCPLSGQQWSIPLSSPATGHRQHRRRLNSEGAAVYPGWEGEPLNLPPSIEDHHTSTPSLGASIRCSIREQMEVGRTHLLQAGLIRRRTPHHSRNRSGCSSLYSLHSLPCRPRCPGVPCWEAYSKTLGWVAEQK